MIEIKKGMEVYVLQHTHNIGNEPGTLTRVLSLVDHNGVSLHPYVYCELIKPMPDVRYTTTYGERLVAVEHIKHLLPKNIEINAEK